MVSHYTYITLKIISHIKHDKKNRFPNLADGENVRSSLMRHSKLLSMEENICLALSNNSMLNVQIFYLIM